MGSSKAYLEFVLEQLSGVEGISCKAMSSAIIRFSISFRDCMGSGCLRIAPYNMYRNGRRFLFGKTNN